MNAEWLAQLARHPAYCFTSDVDWASESLIDAMLTLIDEADVPVTPFLTHRSAVIEAAYRDRLEDVGLHPNFGPGSTHGATPAAVITHVHALWPSARAFRSHGFFESSTILQAMVTAGFRYDSNLCLHLQPGLVPLQHATGLLRFPVFLEDDVMAARGDDWTLTPAFCAALQTPGLKIFNVHPIHVGLNTPDLPYYARYRHLTSRDDWRAAVHAGPGVRTFLDALLAFVTAHPGLGIFSLRELHDRATTISPAPARAAAAPMTAALYDASTAEARAEMVRRHYDARDPLHIYATSRDTHLRELEIDFLIETLTALIEQSPGDRLRILDVGCGNGYSDLRIAEALEQVDLTGIDFSETMIRGAQQLAEARADRRRGQVTFASGDVRTLPFPDGSIDVVISERCLLNLPDDATQDLAIAAIRKVLRPGGWYIAVEGTRDGLRRLNALRHGVGLPPIPDRGEDNVSSLKFDEADLPRRFAAFEIVERRYFGMYYLISRVVQPFVVAPDPPQFDASINVAARILSPHIPDIGPIGHVMGLVLRAKETA